MDAYNADQDEITIARIYTDVILECHKCLRNNLSTLDQERTSTAGSEARLRTLLSRDRRLLPMQARQERGGHVHGHIHRNKPEDASHQELRQFQKIQPQENITRRYQRCKATVISRRTRL